MARHRTALVLLPILPFLFLGTGHHLPAFAPPAAAAATGDDASGHFRLTDEKVHVYDLAGHVELVPATGSAVTIDTRFGGRDAGRLGVANVARDGACFVVTFPSDHLRWSEGGKGSSTTVELNDDGTFREGDHGGWGGRTVRIDQRPGGLDAWADLEIGVPRGQDVDVRVGVGHVTVGNVDGALRVGCVAAGVTVNGTHGRLRVATGSGDIAARDADGELAFATGSGDLYARGLSGGSIRVGTGSGDVTVESVRAGDLRAGTGSGRLVVRGATASDVALATGTGDVTVELARRVDRLKVSTGSGAVRIAAPSDLGATLRVNTGSGGVESEFPLKGMRHDAGMYRATLGDGRGDIVVSTGSGDVTLSRR